MNKIDDKLAPNLKISRILTGLWQVADMERGGQQLDLDKAAKALIPYVEAGLTTFDMADHYGSSELITGVLHKKYIAKEKLQLLTKWVPPPGKVSKETVRKAVQTALDLSLIHIPSPRDRTRSRMPSSA